MPKFLGEQYEDSSVGASKMKLGEAYNFTGSLTKNGSNVLTEASFLSESTYSHIQAVAAAIWSINHNLGFRPNVAITDNGGNMVEGEVVYLNLNQLEIHFNIALQGEAYLS